MSKKVKGSVAVIEAPVVPVKPSTSNQESRKVKQMSKTETSTTPAAPQVEEIEKKVKFFDLSTFELKETPVKVSFTPPATFDEAVSALNSLMGSDPEKMKAALTPILRDAAIASQKKIAVGENGAPKKIVLDYIKNYRDIPPFSSIVTTEKGKSPDWKKQYDVQTVRILEEIKNVPFIVNAIKAAAALSTASDEDED
jgi:hypothetical protein